MKWRVIPRMALAVLAIAAVLTATCDLVEGPGYRVLLKNSGRDPIHIGGVRCAQNATAQITWVGGDYGTLTELKLSRNDIDLGKLKLTAPSQVTQSSDVTVMMTEPVYFDFRFASSDPSKVEVEYIKP